MALTLSALALSRTLEISSGGYSVVALGWLTASLIFCGAALALVDSRHPPEASRLVQILLVVGIIWQLRSHFRTPPGMYLAGVDLTSFKAGVVANALILGLAVPFRRTLAHVWFPAFLLMSTWLGWWVLTVSPRPAIDVVVVHRAAIDALLHGHNPYAITFANIYGAGSPFYSPSEIEGDRVLFGYPYPPLSLLLALPGALLFGDYRYSLLLALVGAAGLIGYGRHDTVCRLAAVLFLTAPRIFFVLEQGWTEPFIVLLIATAVFAASRAPRVTAVVGGLLLSLKQYLVLAVPALWALGRSFGQRLPMRHFFCIVIGVALVVTMPFFVWNPRPFIRALVLVQLQEPFRTDSLSYLSLFASSGWGEWSGVWTLGAAVAAVIFALFFAGSRTSCFPLMLAFVHLATFAFGRKAFGNYYFLVLGALCCAIGELGVASRSDGVGSTAETA